jgi:hypothetical protein
MKYIQLFCIMILAILHSCTWDKLPMDGDMLIPCNPVIILIPNPSDTCFEFDEDYYNLPFIGYHEGFAAPCYNPLNKYELIYAYSSDTFTQNIMQYRKINFCTGDWQLTYPSMGIVGQPKWSNNDWILLGNTGSIYKMKSNGDSLTYLNDIAGMPVLNNATWIAGGEKIFCYAGSGVESDVILDKNGTPLDTIPFAIGTPACLGNNIAGYRYLNDDIYICVYDLVTQTITDIAASPFNVDGSSYSITSLDWLNPQVIIWTDNSGIHTVNTNGEIATLKESCDSRFYYYLSASPDFNGDFMVGRDQTWVVNDTAYLKSEILKINAYSGEEWIVNLQQ